MTNRAWQVYLCVGMVAVAVYFALPGEGVAQMVVYMLLQVAVLVALGAGVAWFTPARPVVWWVLLGAQTLYLVANVFWYLYPVVAGVELSFPGTHDPLFNASYSLEVVALGVLVRVRGRRPNRADLIDATIVALGMATLLWVFQIDRALQGSTISALGQAFTIAYPMFDLILFAMVIRLVVAGGYRSPAFWLLGAAVVAQLGSDIGYTETVLQGSFHYGSPIFAGWLLMFVFLGAAALHPTMGHLAAPVERAKRATLRRRLPFLAVAALTGPTVLVWQYLRGSPLNLPLVVIITAVVFLLILARVSDLMVDVSEHERVQDQLSRLALIVESTDDAVVGWAADGTITSWNSGATRLFGYRSDEIVGLPLALIGPPNGGDATVAMLERVLTGEQVEHFDSECTRKGGSVVDVSITMSAIRDRSGEVVGGAAIGRDITHAKHLQVELLAARDQALDASRMKSDFLATMSHEIRTPMNGVIGLTGLLLTTALDERQRQYADGVRGAGESLLTVINDILDFSKIEAGKLVLDSKDFDLGQLVDDVAALIAGAAQSKRLELAVWCDPKLPTTVRGDPGRLRQVLINLAGNAVKFTERGEVLLRITPIPAVPDRVGVRFEVIDSGIGISAMDVDRLFEPFSQVDASATRSYGGTGLGLAISSQLVAAMGGRLGVTSELGHGSTFAFEYAFHHAVEAGCVASRRPPVGLLEGIAVLVVDDNATNRLILHDQLAGWRMKPVMVADGASALDCLRDAAAHGNPYRLALLDMCMAGMDGIELAERISADPTLDATRLVLLTSAGHVEPAVARAAGLVEVLSKPVRQSRLFDTVMDVLVGSKPEPTAVFAHPARDAALDRGRVLVVEDNPTNQMVAVGILAHLGWAADVAGDGLAAIDAVARVDYDALLMDCQMPKMDGYACTSEIRRREGAGRRVPIIAMTASAVAGDRERCLAAGMDDYIAKPVTPDDIDKVLAGWTRTITPSTTSTPVEAELELGRAHHRELHTGSSNGAVDTGRLDVLRDIGTVRGELLTRMIDAFIVECPTVVAELRRATTAIDAPAIARAAHRLKGAAANLGATTMADLCAELEQAALCSDLSNAASLLDLLVSDFECTRITLNSICPAVAS